MISTKDIAWLAGLLEGEGCFRIRDGRTTPLILLGMTDSDVVDRAAALLGSHDLHVYESPVGHKTQFRLRVGGRKAAAWMMTIYPLMGERRQAKIRETLATWRSAPGRGNFAVTPDDRKRRSEQMKALNKARTPGQWASLKTKAWATRRARNKHQPVVAPTAA